MTEPNSPKTNFTSDEYFHPYSSWLEFSLPILIEPAEECDIFIGVKLLL